ncbi:hypothetical protein V0U79_01755 [Hyphobacterium sp. HN65]|uniref:Uncharacterized protein n=1 Tax=Hyphobacterium lacteum TaxID=3116575 RepID=A0ABU7LMH5_9PROT|nr:hypothetical protein [Hyphobacterium sp. HN65]MEE2525073.1 hypothetical protein [Hyphobacterium sp. HN65]
MSEANTENAVHSPPASSARPSDEMLPFLNNFHDIFTTIGVLILLGGMTVGIVQLMSGLGIDEGSLRWQMALMGMIGGFAVVVWMLSALLVGRQRRILPGIVLCGAFSASATIVLVWAYLQFLQHGIGITEIDLESRFANAPDDMEFGREAVNYALANIPIWMRITPLIVGIAALLPVAMFYFSFRLPFAGGLMGVGFATLVALALFTFDPYTVGVYAPTVMVAIGGALMLAGIVFDARDPGRETRLAGTAFWLHFFAAPILLSAVLNVVQIGWTLDEADFANPENLNLMAAMASDSGQAMQMAVVALTVIALFALVSLLINRRALIVSGLLTAGISIAVIVNQSGLEVPAVVAITLLTLGGIVVLLGAAWNPVRGVLLAPVPSSGPIARIFPPVSAAEG